ncbi:neugrin-like [Argopecten irradians]|uniref:neugrin-like n=1 Tax=Argopecten irradians TaxID=31199 RepID=UPI00371E0857
MLRLTSLAFCNKIHRFVINFSVRNNHDWSEENDLFPDEEPELPNRADMLRMEKEHRQFVKQKILQKKNFPMPKEAFVLTWEALEQMRFLNREFPEEWTIERLTESFPVSRHAAIKILKSGRSRPSQTEIIRHNRIVQRNLEALRSGNVEGNELLMNTMRSLTESNKINLLNNSEGAKGLPMPTKEQSYPDMNKELSFEEKLAQLRVRPFTSILAKYNRLQPKATLKEHDENAKVMIDSPKTENMVNQKQYIDGNSKFGQRSASYDSSRSEYSKTQKLPEETSLFGNLPRSKADHSSISKLDASPRIEYGDLNMEEYTTSSSSSSSRISQLEDSQRSRSPVSSKSRSHHIQQNSSYDTDIYDSETMSISDIGSDNLQRLYSEEEDENTVSSNIRNSSTKKYLSRKEKKELQGTKVQQLPSSKTWDELALYGTGKKIGY